MVFVDLLCFHQCPDVDYYCQALRVIYSYMYDIPYRIA